jgi:hypothetical protein
MASFTDIIPQFNPYVQQLPVEAIVKVGMAKQQAYEQNVTKIQAEIDRVAGLEIERGVDKKYLQSKLNALGNRLSILAGGDFSNFQLANAVGGMTSQIAKDKTIRTAVASTAWAKEQKAKIEKGKSDGTYGVENEDLYNKAYSKWINGTTFSTEYIPYKDVYKKLRDIAKDVGVDENTVQNLFNEDGTISKAMVETHYKGKDPNKIYDAFVNGLDETDYRQLAITGRYKYKGADAEQLGEVLKTSNNEFISAVSARKLDLENELKRLSDLKLKAKTPEEKLEIENREKNTNLAIKKLDDQITESNSSLNQVLSDMSTKGEDFVDGIRARIHQNKFLTSLSKDFAEKSSYVKYLENPLWKAILEEEKFSLDKWYKQQQVNLEAERNAIELRKAKAAEKANQIAAGELIAAPIEGGKVNMTAQVMGDMATMLSQRRDLLTKVAQNAFSGDAAKMKAYVDQQVKASGGRKSAQDVILEVGIQEYSKLQEKRNKGTLDRNLATTLDMFDALNTQVNGFKQVMDREDKKARALSGLQGDADYSNILSQLKTETHTFQKGWPLNYFTDDIKTTVTPAEQIELMKAGASWNKSFKNDYDKGIIASTRKKYDEKYGSTTTDALLSMYGAKAKGYSGEGLSVFETKDPERAKVYESMDSEKYEAYTTALEKGYKEAFSGYYPMNYGFTLNDKNRSVVTGKVNAMLAGRDDYNEIAALMNQANSQVVATATPSLTGLGPNKYTVTVSGKAGEEYKTSQPVEISEEAYSYLTGLPAPSISPVQVMARATVGSSPDGSSNPNGVGQYQTSWFKGGNFSHVKNYNIVGADFTQTTEDPSLYYPTLYYKPSGTNEVVPVPVHTTLDLNSALSLPSIMNANKVSNILKSKGY